MKAPFTHNPHQMVAVRVRGLSNVAEGLGDIVTHITRLLGLIMTIPRCNYNLDISWHVSLESLTAQPSNLDPPKLMP